MRDDASPEGRLLQALFTAARYPELVGKAVVVSANVRRDAIPLEMLAQQGQVSAAVVEFIR